MRFPKTQSEATRSVVQRLAEIYRTGREVSAKRGYVVEEELCQHALGHITTRLPEPGTCDIIDINPGPGVWSRALHHVLKPRRHVLVESDRERFAEFLDPLLQQEGSRYVIAPDAQAALDHEQDFLSPELRSKVAGNPVQKAAASSKLTDELIITANFSGSMIRNRFYTGDSAKFHIQQYWQSIWDYSRIPFSKYGLVRLLAWVPEHDKHSIVPRSTLLRVRQALNLEIHFNIQEIGCAFPYNGESLHKYSKAYSAEMYRRERLERIRKESGYSVPPGRELPPPEPQSFYYKPVEKNFEALLALKARPARVDQFIEFYQTMKATRPTWLKTYIKQIEKDGNRSDRLGKTPETAAFMESATRMRTYHANNLRNEALVSRQIGLERELHTDRTQHPDDDERYQRNIVRLRPELDQIKSIVAKLPYEKLGAYLKLLDDHRADLRQVLAWNAQTRNPLLTHRSDFFSGRMLSVLSFEPLESVISRVSTADRHIYLNYLTFTFSDSDPAPISTRLAQLLGNKDTVAEFVKEVPSLFDIGKGGWHDLDELRCRTLSRDHYLDIVRAWENWPGRPEAVDLVSQIRSRQ